MMSFNNIKTRIQEGGRNALLWTQTQIHKVDSNYLSSQGNTLGIFERSILNLGAYTRFLSYIPVVSTLCIYPITLVMRVALGALETYAGLRGIYLSWHEGNLDFSVVKEALKRSWTRNAVPAQATPLGTLIDAVLARAPLNPAQAATRDAAVENLSKAFEILGHGAANLGRAYLESTLCGLIACAVYDLFLELRLTYHSETPNTSLSRVVQQMGRDYYSRCTAALSRFS